MNVSAACAYLFPYNTVCFNVFSFLKCWSKTASFSNTWLLHWINHRPNAGVVGRRGCVLSTTYSGYALFHLCTEAEHVFTFWIFVEQYKLCIEINNPSIPSFSLAQEQLTNLRNKSKCHENRAAQEDDADKQSSESIGVIFECRKSDKQHYHESWVGADNDGVPLVVIEHSDFNFSGLECHV